MLEGGKGKGIEDVASFLLDRVGHGNRKSLLLDFTLSDRTARLAIALFLYKKDRLAIAFSNYSSRLRRGKHCWRSWEGMNER
ncbi:MAG TPA: hypothetical protein V6C85_26050 [Allocoleopsis sp.]